MIIKKGRAAVSMIYNTCLMQLFLFYLRVSIIIDIAFSPLSSDFSFSIRRFNDIDNAVYFLLSSIEGHCKKFFE